MGGKLSSGQKRGLIVLAVALTALTVVEMWNYYSHHHSPTSAEPPQVIVRVDTVKVKSPTKRPVTQRHTKAAKHRQPTPPDIRQPLDDEIQPN